MSDVTLQPEQNVSENQQLVRMRPIEISDADIVADWFQHLEDVSIFDRQLPLPINHTDVLSLIKSLVSDQKKQKCRWFIAESTDGTAIGMTGLEGINLLHGHAILPLFITEPCRRSGIGIRMACMMIDLAFKQLRLHRVSTIYRADNGPSAALLDRLGFKQEGVARQSWFSHGQYFDLMNVGLLLDEWEQARPALRTMLSNKVIVELGPRSSTEWRWPGTR
ncbi:GNAT family N-acetyltransferase [Granulosicoccus antarcticus]|uniref:Ribosomal N-acetyltransferase YdaF n=1 Tax=Granulosicoccus antarcticus IMCC3135 TaxID=1192854 RepID=A0A2Z2NJU0_9GAMM|nr:GNAT family protein [Granulosicoccus antarcticus]ASJ71449.1 Putative ribosomal N-acetyltransferase YdaF [Granulosicoccus antarcticus IMCC3135]